MNRCLRTCLCIPLCISLTLPGCASTGGPGATAGPTDPVSRLEPGKRVVVRTHDGNEKELTVVALEGDCVRSEQTACAVRVEDVAEVRDADPDTGKHASETVLKGVLVLAVILLGIAGMAAALQADMEGGSLFAQ